LSCIQWGALRDVPFNSDFGKEKLAAHSPRERELVAVPVKVIPAHAQSPARFFDSD
jgi:hypothetical protein